jgi:hypothetical protein
MLGRRSKAAVIEKEVTDAGSKAADTVAEFAGMAVAAARDAQRAATPVLRSAAHSSAETLSHAAGKAAEVLADTADRLATTDAGISARTRIADASEAFAGAVRPKQKRHRIRKLFIVSTILGGIYAVLKYTPLKSKISELAFGPAMDEEEPEPITLPVTPPPTEASSPPEVQADEPVASEPPNVPAAEGGDGVVTGSTGKGDGAKA